MAKIPAGTEFAQRRRPTRQRRHTLGCSHV
jgi:hypothetical protein